MAEKEEGVHGPRIQPFLREGPNRSKQGNETPVFMPGLLVDKKKETYGL